MQGETQYLSFHNSFFCLKILFNGNGKATSVNIPLVRKWGASNFFLFFLSLFLCQEMGTNNFILFLFYFIFSLFLC